MYLCTYTYIYIYIYTCTYIYIYIGMHLFVCMLYVLHRWYMLVWNASGCFETTKPWATMATCIRMPWRSTDAAQSHWAASTGNWSTQRMRRSCSRGGSSHDQLAIPSDSLNATIALCTPSDPNYSPSANAVETLPDAARRDEQDCTRWQRSNWSDQKLIANAWRW